MGANNTKANIDINQIKTRLKSPRLKLKEEGILFEMKNGKIGIISKSLKIYETRSFQIIQEIKNEERETIKKMFELDNNDLILISTKRSEIPDIKYNYIIKIYRLKNEKYELFQIIDDDNNGYQIKIKKMLGITKRSKKILYNLNDIVRLSQNKFITVSDLGFKIYSLSNNDINSKYTLYFTYKNEIHDHIKYIYPINENELIIIYYTNNYSLNFFIPGNYSFDIEKFDIKKNKKIKNIYNKKRNHLRDSISYSNFIIIKSKYLVIIIMGSFYIFDIIKGDKKFVISPSWNDDVYGNLYNWESINDDIFLLIQNKQFIFIQFNEAWNKLNIIGNFELIMNINIENNYLKYDKNKEIKKFKNKIEFYNYDDGFINFY